MSLKVLIAPDKFKGSLTAEQVCASIHSGLLRADPSLYVIEQPVADGGEGTCELLTNYSHGTFIPVRVHDPLQREINSVFGLSEDRKTAFIEMAKASGLQLLQSSERNPWITSTAGTGEMIRFALDAGAEHIVMGIGGSATNDGGMGMASALGVGFYDSDNVRLKGKGSDLQRLHHIDSNYIHPRLDKVRFTVFCDVNNPLFGPNGAAYVFSPQKGADRPMVDELDQGLRHYCEKLQGATGRSVNFPGAGAGGGLPAALKAFANIELSAGMEFIIDFIDMERKVANADIVFTGEGKVDSQTLAGKVVKGIADLSEKYRKPLIVVAGKSELTLDSLQKLKPAHLITLVNQDTSERTAMENAFDLIETRVAQHWPAIFNGIQK